MKNGRSTGPSTLSIELIENGLEQLLELITYVFKCFLRDDLPEGKYAYISNLYKKGDRQVVSIYRGLSVTNSISRLYGRIIKDRIKCDIEDVEKQIGFCAGRSLIENIFVLKQLIEKRMARNLETHLVFIVKFEKACYDSIPLNKL